MTTTKAASPWTVGILSAALAAAATLGLARGPQRRGAAAGGGPGRAAAASPTTTAAARAPGMMPPGPPAPRTPPVPPRPAAPVPGLRVLIVYASSRLSACPPAQYRALFDPALRDYLDAATPAVDGAHEYRFWDRDAGDAHLYPARWRRAMADAAAASREAGDRLPWIVVFRGTAATSGPMPADVAGTLALLGKAAEAD